MAGSFTLHLRCYSEPYFAKFHLPEAPVRWVEPFRIAERYGLFAVMTHERYEIEFQGSRDGKTWVPYPFGHKPQDIYKAPGIYAPYQPRFDWNLWFASLGSWREYPLDRGRRGITPKKRPAGSAIVRGQSLRRSAAADGTRGALAVLVYRPRRTARFGSVVEKGSARAVLPGVDHGARWKNRRRRFAARATRPTREQFAIRQ